MNVRELLCDECHSALVAEGEDLVCPVCGKTFYGAAQGTFATDDLDEIDGSDSHDFVTTTSSYHDEYAD